MAKTSIPVDVHVHIPASPAFRWIALLGSWSLLSVLAFLTMCCGPMLTRIPERDEQMSRAVELRVVCGAFAELLTDKPGAIGIGQGAGSGVIVGPHRILTAAHVPTCDDGKSALVWAKLGGTWVQTTLARSYEPARDIAALYVEANTGFVPIEYRASVKDYESVCAAMAYPKAHYDCGSFKGYRDLIQGINGTLGIPVVSGNSGSGVFDRQGRLVGIVTAQLLCNVELRIEILPIPNIDADGNFTIDMVPVPSLVRTGGPNCDGLASMFDTVVQP